ncbi:MAG: hypothetical protein ACRDSR_09415 [Pseudonocardiaceae bacterium]
MNGHKLPELVALCREDEDGEEQVAGWAMVLTDRVVGCIPDRAGDAAYTFQFQSLDSTAQILGYSGIYPVEDLATLPAAR